MDTFNTHVDFKHRAFIFASSLVKVAMALLKTEYIERRPQWDCKLLILKPLVRQRKCRTTKQIEGNCCWTLSTKLICELFSASLQVKAQLMTFFSPFIPAPFSLQELVTTQPECFTVEEDSAKLSRIKACYSCFFFLVLTGVKHPYPIVLNRTLPHSALLEEVNLDPRISATLCLT